MEVIPPECRFRPAFHRVSQDVLRLITDEREYERLSVRFPHNPLERIHQVPEALLHSYGVGGGPTQFGSPFRHLRLEFIARLAKFFFRPLALADVAADRCKANVSAVWIRKRAYVVKHPDGCAGLKMAEPDLDFATTFAEGLGEKLLNDELPIFGKEIVFDVGLQRLLQTVQSHQPPSCVVHKKRLH